MITEQKKLEMPILDVSREFLMKLFDSEGEKYLPLGRFICEEEVGWATIYTAVDNVNGEAWTEEFGNRRQAVKWLNGNASKNRFGDKLEEREIR